MEEILRKLRLELGKASIEENKHNNLANDYDGLPPSRVHHLEEAKYYRGIFNGVSIAVKLIEIEFPHLQEESQE